LKKFSNQFRNLGGETMLYVERDAEGSIIAMHSLPQPNVREEKAVIDEEILDYLIKTVSADSRKLLLALSDMGIIRLVEDLVDLLIKKNIICYTELPEQAQKKIQERRRLRETKIPQTLTVDNIL
jgi:hypothetical protein